MYLQKQLSLQLLFAWVFDHIIDQKDKIQVSNQTWNLPVNITLDEVFSLVVNNYIDKLYRYINYSFNLQKHSTEDIVQEIYLNLPKKLLHFDVNQKLDPWLFKVAHNVALDYIKRTNTRNEKEIYLDIIATEDFIYKMSSHEWEISQSLESAYHEWLLRFVLWKMDMRNRQMIILYFFEHNSYEEIANIIWVKASWVWTLLSRAKKQLKLLIEQDSLLQDALVYDLPELI